MTPKEHLGTFWGKRCSEYDYDCSLCMAWEIYDITKEHCAKIAEQFYYIDYDKRPFGREIAAEIRKGE